MADASRADIRTDVAAAVALPGEHALAVSVFAPSAEALTERPALLFCLPGGTYTRAYWHREVPGRAGFSFAEHLARQGYVVVTVDYLGIGESSRNVAAADLTIERVAAANAAALAEVLARLADGEFAGGPITVGRPIGVGHSMGGMLTIYQQALHRSFDAVAILGWGNLAPFELYGARAELPDKDVLMAAARAGAFEQPPPADRGRLHHLFHWEDVSSDVIRADDADLTDIPGLTGALRIAPLSAAEQAAEIAVPVFICMGERDVSVDPHREVTAYRSARDISLLVLPRSGHCHNTAGTRMVLWDRIGRWVPLVTGAGAPVDSASRP
jgi:pimeloyl-ACP methyl ester carboxylesterase